MIGFSADNYVFRYDNVCGMLQIPVVGTGKISKVIFYGNDGEPVAGKFSEQYKVLIESGSSRNITYSPVPPSDSEDLSFINRAMTVTDTARVIYIDCGEGIQLDPDNAPRLSRTASRYGSWTSPTEDLLRKPLRSQSPSNAPTSRG